MRLFFIHEDVDKNTQILIDDFGDKVSEKLIAYICGDYPQKQAGWIIKQLADNPEVAGKWPEDEYKFVEAIEYHIRFKDTPKYKEKFKELFPDIPEDKLTLDRNSELTLNHILDIKDALTKKPSKRKEIQTAKQEGSKIVDTFYDDNKNECKILQIGGEGIDPDKAAEAAVQYAKHTRWCTSKKEIAKARIQSAIGSLYILFVNGEKTAQFDKSGEIADVRNKPVNKEIGNILLKSKIINKIQKVIIMIAMRLKIRWPEAEPIIIKHPEYAYYYVIINNNKKRWPEAEPTMMKSPEFAYKYAKNIIKRRWPEAEQYLMKDPQWAYFYAKDMIEDRWPEAEPYIMKSPEAAYLYARDMIEDRRWPEAEPYIMKDPEAAYLYAANVIEDRWPEAEPYIMKNQKFTYLYVTHVIKDRWPEAEPYIMKDPEAAHNYAEWIKTHIGADLPEAKSAILKDPRAAYNHALYVIGDRWLEAEPIIIKDPEIAYLYASDVIKKRWLEAEPTIMKDPEAAYLYAANVIEDRWPEAEPIIKTNKRYWKEYTTLFEITAS